jgi:hypothetical protein
VVARIVINYQGSTQRHKYLQPFSSTHIALALDGVEIISNSSGSHHELRKSNKRINIIRNATAKVTKIFHKY